MTTWLASGVRTPFAQVDGPLRKLDAIELSVPVAKAMAAQLPAGDRADVMVWGTVAPNLGWSNIAREVLIQARPRPGHARFLDGDGVLHQHGRGIRGGRNAGRRASTWRCAAAWRA